MAGGRRGDHSEVAGLDSRLAAWRVLRRVHADGAWSTLALDAELRAGDLAGRDRSFAANLAYETLRWEGTLDWALGQVLTRPLDAVEDDLLDVLRLGAWQLLYGRTPDRAAVGTAVEVARVVVGPRATGFTNGVLRSLSRTDLPWPRGDDAGAIGIRLGYPAWVVDEARTAFGDRAGAVLEAGNDAPGLTLRAVGDRDALVAELQAAGLDARPGQLAPEAVRVPGADPGALPAVAEGRAVPQDEASMVVARALAEGLEPGSRVLDLCAAPGGKATHLAQLGLRVVAADLRPRRARMVTDAATRAGVGVAVVAGDAERPPFAEGTFDAVLLDAPCTGLGVVRRRPELRWRREAGDPQRLAGLQLRLAETAVAVVRPGGRLLYSVCTWTRAETTGVVGQLLAVMGDEVQVESDGSAGAGTGGVPGRLLGPDTDGTDGMFLVSLRRGG